MSIGRIPLVVALLSILFLFQESFINRINFLVGGFSLYLAFVIAWIIREERTSAMIIGFIAGLIADLSPTLEAPFGLWTFVLTGFSYLLVTSVRGALDAIDSPLMMTFVTTVSATSALLLFVITGVILGQEVASISVLVGELLGNAIWTLVLAPIYVPMVLRMQRLTLTARER
jgi:rod shape-determining protein MreD